MEIGQVGFHDEKAVCKERTEGSGGWIDESGQEQIRGDKSRQEVTRADKSRQEETRGDGRRWMRDNGQAKLT